MKIYTSPNCSHCQALKAYLKNKGIDFTEIDITIEFDEFLGLLKRSANPKVKEPDKELARLMERAKEFCRKLEKDETDKYSYMRFKLLATKIMKILDS